MTHLQSNFHAAVLAIQAGDVASLQTLLDAWPSLIKSHAPKDTYCKDAYFREPALLWFVANNPNLITTMPATILQVTQTLLDAGAAQDDLNYTLGLVTTSRPAREEHHQLPLMKLLLAHGATADAASHRGTLGHKERQAMQALLDCGITLTAPVAAGMGMLSELPALLASADADQIHDAFSLAVINSQREAANLCLQAGADVNAYLTAHAHSTAAHQASINNHLPMLQLLVAHRCKLNVKDTLWHATPLAWAKHNNCSKAQAYLETLTDV